MARPGLSWKRKPLPIPARHREQEAESRSDTKTVQQAAPLTKAAEQRAELAQDLAIQKAEAAGLNPPGIGTSIDPLAMPSRQVLTDTAGTPKGKAQRNHR